MPGAPREAARRRTARATRQPAHPQQRGRARRRIVYVLGEFPSISETFILREMVALEGMGFHLLPLSMEQPAEGPVHEEDLPFVDRTLHRPPPLSRPSFSGLLRTALHRPLGFMSGLLFTLRNAVTHPRDAKELLSAFAAAAFFASRLPARHTRHIHAHFASYPGTVGLLLAEICGASFSLSCHAQDIFADKTILLPRKMGEAEFVTVCTQYGLERLQRLHTLSSSDKLHLLYHGLDASRIEFLPHVEYPLPLIVSVGRLVEKKGFPFLLQAAAVLHGRGVQFELIIVGDGPMRDELERLASGLGPREKVVFAGQLTQEELSHVYRRADAFCLPCIVAKDGDRDGLPNVILEAMAYGVPVVASNLSAIPEVIVNEETGLLAAPGSAHEIAAQLERVLSDGELRRHLIANARRKVEEDFDLQKNTVRLGALFAEALGWRDWPPMPGGTTNDPRAS
ncbi:MAG: glycosyltransferase family 4 protein [Bacteroidota bacterium]